MALDARFPRTHWNVVRSLVRRWICGLLSNLGGKARLDGHLFSFEVSWNENLNQASGKRNSESRRVMGPGMVTDTGDWLGAED